MHSAVIVPVVMIDVHACTYIVCEENNDVRLVRSCLGSSSRDAYLEAADSYRCKASFRHGC